MSRLRYAIRALSKTPTFALVVVMTLALGIGANTAIFSVVDAVLLKPLPYPDADRIVSFAWNRPSGVGPANVTPLTFQYWRDHARAFDAFAVTSGGSFNLVAGSAVERVKGASGTADFFKVLGVSPVMGRAFLPDECLPGAAPVAVISHGMWQRVLGGAPDAIGTTVTLNDRPYVVIGVMPAQFTYEPAVDLWYPLQLRVDPRDRGWNYTVMARLRAETSMEQAQAETDRLFEAFQAEYAQHVPRAVRTITLVRFQDFMVSDMRALLLVLTGAVGLVLLIACGNVANLMLSRSAARQRDLAIRSALGATRTHLAGQVITESLLLSGVGGVAGVLLAAIGVRTLVALIPGDLPRLHTVTVDARVLGFACLISMLVGLVFGLVGTTRLLKAGPGEVLKAAAGTGVDVVRHRLSNTLVVTQVALSVVLLTGAGLLAATFVNLRAIPIGFDTNNLITVQLPLSAARFGSPAAIARLDQRLIDRLGAIPGVASVTTSSSIPLERGPNFIFGIDGEPPDKINYVELRPIGPDYFRTVGIPLRAGRDPSLSSYGADDRPVVVVNESLANLFGGPTAALGHRVIIGRTTPGEDLPREIVGVVSNVADGRPGTRLFPTLYIPRGHFTGGAGTAAVLIRTSGPIQIAAEIRRIVQAIDPQLPVTNIRSMNEVAAAAVGQQRFNMALVGLFAAVALALTMVGLYGLLSYQVAQRTREIGVRMALGASRSHVLRAIVLHGVLLSCAGVAIGVAGSLGLARFLTSLLFGVSATSPWIFLAVAALLLVVAGAASAIPARRAIAVDPVTALRCE